MPSSTTSELPAAYRHLVKDWPRVKSEMDMDSELTLSPLPHRQPHSRPHRPAVVPPPQTTRASPSVTAISSHSYNTNNTISQDVLPFVNASASHQSSSTVTRNNVVIPADSSSASPSQHVSLTSSQSSPPRTFLSTKDLASHYGIPQILPPAPRTTPRERASAAAARNQSSGLFPDFNLVKTNYLNMLAQKPSDSTMVVDSTPAASAATIAPADLAAPVVPASSSSAVGDTEMSTIIENILASPEFQSYQSFDEKDTTAYDDSLFTSPLLNTPFDTPYDDFSVTSPNDDDSPFSEFLTTPLIADSDEMFPGSEYTNMPLFPDMGIYESFNKATQVSEELPKLPANSEEMYTIDQNDSLDPSSLSLYTPASSTFPSPALNAPTSTSTLGGRRKPSATGTRKNITPDSLVPLDAPTQPRKYVTPSATSRKEVPAVFSKKRARSVAFPDELDELDDNADLQPPLAPNASEKEQIEWKRRQNTLAARKSRKRKLEHQQWLEGRVEELEREAEMWKTRSDTLMQILRSHGVPFDAFED